MKIFINAGHGGKDCGAVSKMGTLEKDITRSVAGFLVEMLIMAGYDVEFYQQKKELEDVVKAERNSNSHLFISLHCNAATNEKAGGVEAFYYKGSGTGEALARLFSDSISEYMELKNRGAKVGDNFRVLNGTKAPAVLIELAFLSNPKEEELLKKEPYSFAAGIMKGIHKWEKMGK